MADQDKHDPAILKKAARKLNGANPSDETAEVVLLEHFIAYMAMPNCFIYMPTRDPWPGTNVNARLCNLALTDDNGKSITPSAWLSKNQPAEQMTWSPGMPALIHDRFVADGGWINHPGATVLNLYRPPRVKLGDATLSGPWRDHIRKVYPNDAGEIIRRLAFKVQHPEVKINHAMVLGGKPGIGKDTILEPVKYAVGPWNFVEISPTQLAGSFNGFTKSVVLRISEARDLGEINRYQFYEHMKVYAASPPDVLRVNEKHLREYSVLNCCFPIITTNYKSDGIYLPADDRRHYVTWSDLTKDDFTEEYWNKLWGWYEAGGYGHVAAYLTELDLSDFDPKAPPPKTDAFWSIVNAGQPQEVAQMADALDRLSNPLAVTISRVKTIADADFTMWLADKKNSKAVAYRMEDCGYIPLRNKDTKDGYWKIGDTRQTVYVQSALSVHDQLKAISTLRSTA